MKKIICIALAAVAALSMCACSDIDATTGATLDAPLTATITTGTVNTVAMEGYNAVATIHDWSKVDSVDIDGDAERTMTGKKDGEYYYWHWRTHYFTTFFHHGLENDCIDGGGMRDITFYDHSGIDYQDTSEEVEWTSGYDESTDTMKIYIYVGCEYTIDFDMNVTYAE